MPDGGSIDIGATAENSEVLVTVEDTGPGIPVSIRPTLFQPFSSSGKRNGLGLGLALSRQAVLDHGGDIWIDEACERGTRFCLKLPGHSA